MDQTLERATAVFPLCTHMKSNGIRCGSPALTGLNFCYQHLGGSVSALARAQATTSSPDARLNLLYPGDHAAIQHNLFQVAQALSEGKINTAMANTYNRIFRTCEQNLHHWEMTQKSKNNTQSGEQDGSPFKPAVGLGGEQEKNSKSGEQQNEPPVSPVVNDQSSPEPQAPPEDVSKPADAPEDQAEITERGAEAMRRFYKIAAELERQQALRDD